MFALLDRAETLQLRSHDVDARHETGELIRPQLVRHRALATSDTAPFNGEGDARARQNRARRIAHGAADGTDALRHGGHDVRQQERYQRT